VRPDAFLRIEYTHQPAGENTQNFFFEADRSSTTVRTRFADKVIAYQGYIDQGLHAERYNIKHIRVLTIATHGDRSKSLCAVANTIVEGRFKRFFLFGHLNGLSVPPEFLHENQFICARDFETGARYPLIPS
jgi:hypothetical protein